jgi:hypothetical protein
MKNPTIPILLIVTFLGLGFVTSDHRAPFELKGAWERNTDGNRITWICSDKYFAATVYNLKEKKFIGTCGGSWKVDGNTFIEVHEFNTMKPEYVGKELRNEIEMKNGKLIFKIDGKNEEWIRVDDGNPGKLAGAWLITGRMNNNELQKITPGARRTMKILSGTRFQWIAYNAETKGFFGTGGGTYATENGKYTENIEFFSRDSTRVGMSLQFDFAFEDENWRHKGLSSKGEPIDEVWTKREKLGL